MIKSEKGKAFRFVKYRISEFTYKESVNGQEDYSMEFLPSGIYDESTGKYSLTLVFKAREKENNQEIISVKGIAEYEFDEPYVVTDLPGHFFMGALPIFFPYIRAFVSNLTLQSNNGIIVLGLINFTGMAEHLKTNTILSDKASE